MRFLHKFLRLPPSDRRLALKAVFLMAAFRVGLWLLPFRQIARLAERSETRLLESGGSYPDRVAWTCDAVGRYVPGATCLVKAFTAKVLLQKAGVPAHIHIGVSKTNDKGFEAHAWVESLGSVVVGAVDLANYTRLPSFDLGLRRDR